MTQESTKNRIAIFPGSFNPFTRGHADIVERSLAIFDRIVIAVGINAEKLSGDNDALLSPIVELYKGNPRVEVVAYHDLTVSLAQRLGACAIVRAVRSVKDYEYERDMADINMKLSGIESVILFCRPEYSAISSSIVRELRNYGQDVSSFLP